MFWYTASCVPTTETLAVMSRVHVVPSFPGRFIPLISEHVPDTEFEKYKIMCQGKRGFLPLLILVL